MVVIDNLMINNDKKLFNKGELRLLILVLFILFVGIINIILIDSLGQYYKYILGIPNLSILISLQFYYYYSVKEIRKNKYVKMTEEI